MTPLGDRPMTPVVLAFLAAGLWGLWWIPIRWLQTLGMEGAWGSVAMNAGAAAVGFLWMLARRGKLRIGCRAAAGAALVGMAVTAYSVAITMADVVRVILLFYLAPGWSKIIEWAFMGRGWHWSSTLTLGASLFGAWLVLGGQASALDLGAGDLLALLSGMGWAGGAALIFTGDRASPSALTFVTCLCALLVGAAFLWLGDGAALSAGISLFGSAMGALTGMVYVLPIMILTLWSAQRLPPATISFLLTAEILSGVVSGAMFLDEPFGTFQAVGTVLILFAGTAEVFKGMIGPPRPG